jgi:phosphodiesterase/alkaline phosphatase D-like protein
MNSTTTQNTEEVNNLNLFIDKINEQREVWLLEAQDGSFAMFEDDNQRSFIPLWPEKDLAQQFASDDWDGYLAERMGLGELLEWMQELKEDEILIGAFLHLNQQAIAVDPVDFKNMIIQKKGK